MKCQRIKFRGYKRLGDTGCNVSQRLLAFVGQNEAGKSSVLQGLEWLTEDGETALPTLDACRSDKHDEGWIVGAFYEFDDEDLAILKPLSFEQVPQGTFVDARFVGQTQRSIRGGSERCRPRTILERWSVLGP